MQQQKIIPSVKLCIVTSHKASDFVTCQRKYHWRWIKNIESVWMNRAYYYGSRAGAGAEALMQGKSWPSAQKAMSQERRRFFSRYKVREADREAVEIDEQLIDVMLQAFRQTEEFGKITLDGSQFGFRVKLRDSDVLFVGTKDGVGTYEGDSALFELKNLKSVTPNVLADLVSDMQINGYGYADRLLKLRPAVCCLYMIFRKSTKWIKRGQSVEDFVQEITDDIAARPEWYFHFKRLRLGRSQVQEVGHDIEAVASDLQHKYRRLGVDGVLDSHNWPRSNACSNFSGCQYRALCNEPLRREVRMMDYQMRELRYEDEKNELQQ